MEIVNVDMVKPPLRTFKGSACYSDTVKALYNDF